MKRRGKGVLDMGNSICKELCGVGLKSPQRERNRKDKTGHGMSPGCRGQRGSLGRVL